MSAITVERVSVDYGTGRHAVRAVTDVSLQLPEGRCLGRVGESGSGKSTLARAVVGLVKLTAGRITVGGAPVRGRPRRDVQLVFQDPFASLNPRRTVGQSVAEGFGTRALRRVRRETIADLLEQVGLERSAADAYPGQLSGGQRQRVALARALAAAPSVLVADEITSALDASVQGAILNLIRELQRTRGFSMLFISHNLSVVRYVSDAIAVMYCGQIVELGPTEDVLGHPEHPYTRSLLESVPTLDRIPEPLPPDTAPAGRSGDPADPAAPPPGCRFHPRCPSGPAAREDRAVCATGDPLADAATRRHHAACFFATTSEDAVASPPIHDARSEVLP